MDSERQKRIQERHERIMKRLNQVQEPGEGQKPVEEQKTDAQPQQQASLTDQKLTEQLNAMQQTTAQYADKIAQIQARADAEANVISENDVAAQAKRKQVLEDLKQENQRQQQAFEMQWAGVIEKKQPEQLLAGLIELRNIMLQTLKEKDDICRALEEYLNQVDDDYLRLISEQAQEVDEVTSFARKTTREVAEKCRDAVKSCEEAFDAERANFIKQQEKELEDLRAETAQVESQAMDQRQKVLNDFLNSLEDNMYEDYEVFTRAKRELEAENAALCAQLEEMRALYILNTEKLDYSYKLLASRDIECQNMIVMQRKRIGKLQAQKNNLVARHQQIDEAVRSENLELSVQYKRLANAYCDLQKKFQLFEAADNQQFKTLWKFHEKEVTDKIQQLLLCEQVINESILCQQPRTEVDQKSIITQIKHMLARLQANTRITTDASAGSQQEETQQFDITKAIDSVRNSKFGEENVRARLRELCIALNFLASDALIQASNPDEAEITEQARVETLLTTLGVRNASELDLLLAHITENQQAQKLVPRDKLIEHLINFAKDLRKAREQLSGEQTTNSRDQGKKGIWSVSDVQSFWRELGFIASTQKAGTWQMLEQVLKQYQEVLMARADLVARNDELAGQNEELRALLQQYVDGERRDLSGGDVEYVGSSDAVGTGNMAKANW